MADPCGHYVSVPTSLNTVEYLGHSSTVHFDQSFLIPLHISDFVGFNNMDFVVPAASLFRIWVEHHHIDIDLYLSENGVTVNSTYNWNDMEEEIVYPLLPNTNYSLEFIYYHYSHQDAFIVDPPCFVYRMELSIAPTGDDVFTGCGNDLLPDQNLIPTPSENQTYFFSSSEYYYTQTSRAFNLNLPFDINDPTYFRAEIRYDFLWSDLSLLLVGPTSDGMTYPEVRFNIEALDTILLAPGSYILQIYEPEPQYPAYQNCIPFELTVAYQVGDSVNMDNYKSTLDRIVK